jgi:hypothetical protein
MTVVPSIDIVDAAHEQVPFHDRQCHARESEPADRRLRALFVRGLGGMMAIAAAGGL